MEQTSSSDKTKDIVLVLNDRLQFYENAILISIYSTTTFYRQNNWESILKLYYDTLSTTLRALVILERDDYSKFLSDYLVKYFNSIFQLPINFRVQLRKHFLLIMRNFSATLRPGSDSIN
jgi:hypothetical protein